MKKPSSSSKSGTNYWAIASLSQGSSIIDKGPRHLQSVLVLNKKVGVRELSSTCLGRSSGQVPAGWQVPRPKSNSFLSRQRFLRKPLLIGSTGGNQSLWLSSLTSAGTGFRTAINKVPHFLLGPDHALDVSTISSVLRTVIVPNRGADPKPACTGLPDEDSQK